MAVGPVAPPVASGADLTQSPFKQCGAMEITTHIGYYEERCNPGTHGRYMYVYINRQESSVLNICEIFIVGASRCHPLIHHNKKNLGLFL